MIALVVGESEEALFQNWIALVPESQCKAESLLVIRNAAQPVLAPSIGAGAGVVMWEVVPSVAIVAVILAHRPPLAFAKIRSPLLPGHVIVARLIETNLFHRIDSRLLITLHRWFLLLSCVSVRVTSSGCDPSLRSWGGSLRHSLD